MRAIKLKCVIFLSLVLFPLCHVIAQRNDSLLYKSFGIRAHYGFIIAHADEIEPVSHTNPAGVEAEFSHLNTSHDRWKVFNTFWMSGLQVAYFNFNNPYVVGSSIHLTAYVEPILASGRKYFLSVRGGAGFSWHSRIYDSIENPANKFFATRVSFPVYVSATINYKLTKRTIISLSGNYNHISNGGIKQPNFGMNFPTVSFGLQYYPVAFPELRKNYKNDIVIGRGITIVTQVLSGYRVVDATDIYPEKGALATGFHVRVAKKLSGYYALNAGTEIIFDGALKEMIRRDGSTTDYKRVALTAGHELLFGRTVFTQSFGFYIYSPYKALRNVYQKYELSYNLNRMLSAGAFLKAHLYVAELMGLQVYLRL